MAVSLTDPNSGKQMSFASENAVDYKVAMKSGYVPSPGLLATQVGNAGPQYSTIQTKSYTANPADAYNEQKRLERPQGTVWDTTKQQYVDPGSGNFFAGYEKDQTTSSNGANAGARFTETPTFEFQPGQTEDLTQAKVDQALAMKKGGSTDGYWGKILEEGQKRGMVNLTQAFSPTYSPGVLSSETAKAEAAKVSGSLDTMDTDLNTFYKNLLDRNTARAAEDADINSRKSAAAQVSLGRQQEQDTNTLKAAEYKTGRTGSMYATAELGQQAESQRAEMEAIKTKYDDLSLQSRRALEDGEVAIAKEYREAAAAQQKSALDLAQFQAEQKKNSADAASKVVENTDKTAKRWVDAGLEPTQKDFQAADAKLGAQAGESELSYKAAKGNFDRDQLTKNIANAKSSAELVKLNNDLKMMTFKNMADVADGLSKMAPGTKLTMPDGSIVFSTNMGHTEVDNDGTLTSSFIDSATGKPVVRTVGNVGKATKEDLETVYVNGVEVTRNKKTKQLAVQTVAGGSGSTGDLGLDAYVEEGSTHKGAYGPLQCGEFQHTFSDSYPYGLNTRDQKAAAVTVPKEQGPQAGFQVFQDVKGKAAGTGHVALCTWVGEDENGKTIMKLTEANYAGPGKVTHTRILAADDPSIIGYRNDPLKPEFASSLQNDNDGQAPTSEESGLKIPASLSFYPKNVKQSEASFAKSTETKENSILAAQQILSGDIKDPAKEISDIKTRTMAVAIAKENGYVQPGKLGELPVEDFSSFAKKKELEAMDKGAFMAPAEGDMKMEYDINQGVTEGIMSAQDVQAGGITTNRLADIRNATMKKLKSGDADRAVQDLVDSAFRADQVGEKTQWVGANELNNQLNGIADALRTYTAKKGDTNILKGTYEDVVNKLGQTSDPELKTIKTRIQKAVQAYRKSATGVAFSEKEGAIYEMMFPGISNSTGLNMASIKGLQQSNEITKESLVRSALGSTFYDNVMSPVEVTSLRTGKRVSIPKYRFDSSEYSLE